MHIQDPQQQQIIGEQISALQQRKQAFVLGVSQLQALFGGIQKRISTAQALQQEAEESRRSARQSLREIIGIPSKSVREAKEKEIAAQSLAEEMLLIAEEEKIQAEMQHEALYTELQAIQKESSEVLKRYCDVVIDEQLKIIQQSFPLLGLILPLAPEESIKRIFGNAIMARDPQGEWHAEIKEGEIKEALFNNQKAEPDEALQIVIQENPALEKPTYIDSSSHLRSAKQKQLRDEKFHDLINR